MRSWILPILTFIATTALAAPAAAESTIYAQAVAHEGRSSQDRERDARELPAEVMAFAGFKPRVRVADVFGGGGYYSELISYVVGPQGEAVIVNNIPYENIARSDITSHGFAFEGSFDKLRNPDDDYSKVIFDPAVRFKTDRFVHFYRKSR